LGAPWGGVGAYLDWAALNQLLPVPEPGSADEIESVHRGRVDEVRILASAVSEMQERVDAAGAGLNPLGLVANVVPFRIIQPGHPSARAGVSTYGESRSGSWSGKGVRHRDGVKHRLIVPRAFARIINNEAR